MGEQDRSIYGYLVAGTIAYLINILLSNVTTLTVTQTTFISIYLIGNLIVYGFDILFAKEKFVIDGKMMEVPYSDLATRAKWLLSSLYQHYFFRFLTTVVIDTLVGLTILKFTINYLDRLKILPNWKYRNYVVAFMVALATYILYLRTLQFNWAYQANTPILLDILVMAWVSLALLIYASNQTFLQQNIPWRFFYTNTKVNGGEQAISYPKTG